MNEWVWSIGGMILTGENEILGEKHYTASVVGTWMSMEHWWNDTDRGKCNTGRKTLYSVGGRWMNEYGALVEWYWQSKAEELLEHPVPVPNSSPNLTFTDVGSIVDLPELVLPSALSRLLFMMSVFIPPLHFICLFSFLSIPYFHCPDWYICAQTAIAKDRRVFLCDTVHCQ